MWDQLRRADVELAKEKLAELRSITLKRHEEELKQLDADDADVETLARLAEAITAKYLDGVAHSGQHTTSVDEQKDGEPGIQPEVIPHPSLRNSALDIGTPLRKLIRRSFVLPRLVQAHGGDRQSRLVEGKRRDAVGKRHPSATV